AYVHDRRFAYANEGGMIDHGWITRYKLSRVISLLLSIENLSCSPRYVRLLKAALIASVRERLADIRFGPELYCLRSRRRTKVKAAFLEKISQFVTDREAALPSGSHGTATVIEADSRD